MLPKFKGAIEYFTSDTVVAAGCSLQDSNEVFVVKMYSTGFCQYPDSVVQFTEPMNIYQPHKRTWFMPPPNNIPSPWPAVLFLFCQYVAMNEAKKRPNHTVR